MHGLYTKKGRLILSHFTLSWLSYNEVYRSCLITSKYQNITMKLYNSLKIQSAEKTRYLITPLFQLDYV